MKMVSSNGKYKWFVRTVLKHAKPLGQSLKKELTTALIAMKVIQHLSLEQHTGMWAKQTEGKSLCEATVYHYLQMNQRQRNSNSSSTKKQSHPWVQCLLFLSSRFTAVWPAIIIKSFLAGSVDHNSAAQHRSRVSPDAKSQRRRLTLNIKEASAAVILLQSRHSKVP